MKKLKKHLKKEKLDGALFFNLHPNNLDSSYYYYCKEEVLGIFFVPTKGTSILFTPKMEKGRVKKQKTLDLSKESLKKIPKNIGIDFTTATYSQIEKIKQITPIKIKDISKHIQSKRIIKTKTEIEIIKKACSITDKILTKCYNKLKTFKTETEVSSFLLSEIIKEGCTPSFSAIVSSGKNAGNPHHIPEKTSLKKGFLIIDFGVKYKGYCSDMTRTFYKGKPSKKEIDIYNKVLKTQKGAISKINKNTSFLNLEKHAKKELGELLNHSLGHGLGLDVHESPFFNTKEKIKQGMVFTIEPGAYIVGKYGIRIEDDILMTKQGPEILTKFPKKLKLF